MPVERLLIADAIVRIRKQIKWANWLFWLNFFFSALSFASSSPMFGFINGAIALWMFIDIKKGHGALEILADMKKKGHRAI